MTYDGSTCHGTAGTDVLARGWKFVLQKDSRFPLLEPAVAQPGNHGTCQGALSPNLAIASPNALRAISGKWTLVLQDLSETDSFEQADDRLQRQRRVSSSQWCSMRHRKEVGAEPGGGDRRDLLAQGAGPDERDERACSQRSTYRTFLRYRIDHSNIVYGTVRSQQREQI